MTDTPPQIFDDRRRAALHQRSVAISGADRFLWQHFAGELGERLSWVKRDFTDALLLGSVTDFADTILRDRNTFVTLGGSLIRDRLAYSDGQFDLIIVGGSLDSVNDLPGALVQLRRALRPDGLLLAMMFGAGTLHTLKSVLLKAEGDRARAHIHPQIELKVASDLLTRTGFALPVADRETLPVRYSDWRRLVADLRAHGVGNALAGKRTFAGKALPAALDRAWGSAAQDDGKVTEHFELLHLSGWAPSPDQPRPAKRGSATMSLAAALADKTA